MVRKLMYDAKAEVLGSNKYPNVKGEVYLKQTKEGVLVTARIYGLPTSNVKCQNGVFGFHIHEGEDCIESNKELFPYSKSHYNPKNCPHPYHSGDLPPLFENNGYAYMTVLTNRFTVEEIIGRVVILHNKPDDFTTQPSGNSGEKIACGEIKRLYMR